MFFAKQSLLVLASLAASAYAINFKLIAEVTASDLTPSINGLALDSYSIHGCGRIATFSSGGAVWDTTEYNTVKIVEGETTNEIFVTPAPGGTPTGFSVAVSCGRGTPGVGIQNGALAYDNGSWIACPNSIMRISGGDDRVVLSYKEAGQPTLAGCADVTLKAVAAA